MIIFILYMSRRFNFYISYCYIIVQMCFFVFMSWFKESNNQKCFFFKIFVRFQEFLVERQFCFEIGKQSNIKSVTGFLLYQGGRRSFRILLVFNIWLCICYGIECSCRSWWFGRIRFRGEGRERILGGIERVGILLQFLLCVRYRISIRFGE